MPMDGGSMKEGFELLRQCAARQNGQSLLNSLELQGSPPLLLLTRHDLGNARVIELVEVLHHV